MKSKSIIAVVILLLAVLIVGAVLLKKDDSQSTSSNENPINSKLNVNEKTNVNTNTPPSNYEIDIKGFAFSPSELRISKGSTVKWTNQDSAKHTVTSDSGNELSSSLFGQGESYSHVFNTAGAFEYHCTPHPSMKAEIIVE